MSSSSLSYRRRVTSENPRWPQRLTSVAAHKALAPEMDDVSPGASDTAAPVGMQAMLATDQPGDRAEREADRVSADTGTMTSAAGADVQPRPAQRVSPGSASRTDAPPSVSRALASPGRPLEPSLRQDMEGRLGHDFSRVRVHSGSTAEQSALDLNALAYAVGHHLVFGAGRFSPGTIEGRRLLAHELAHVVQQDDVMAVIQRAPATGRQWAQDEAAARYRGLLMANRIRTHGVLSKEARAKINQELAYFEGAAKEAYVREVRPALLAVTWMERPPPRPRPIGLSLLGDDARLGSFTDEQIYAPLTAAKQRDDEELAREREGEIEALRKMTQGWGDDQDFALGLLGMVLQHNVHPDQRGVHDAIRPPLIDRYTRWLHAVDKNRAEECKSASFLEKSRARFRNDDPCVSWFEQPSSHGPSELEDLERRLTMNRASSLNSLAELVYYDVFEYRRKTDRSMLEEEQIASAMVGILAATGRDPSAGVRPSGTVSPAATVEKDTVVSGTPSPRVAGFGRDIEPASDVAARTSPRVAGFGRDIEPATDVPARTSPRVAGFGRDIEPPPSRGPAVQDMPTTTQMPSAGNMPSAPSSQAQVGQVPQVSTGQRRDEPATAMAGKPPSGDKPKITVPKSAAGSKGPRVNPRVAAEDLDRIKQLREWDKKGKITGDVSGLENWLRSDDPARLEQARDEFKDANESIAKGEKVHLEDHDEGPRAPIPESTKISTGEKSELEDSAWLKGRLPDPEDRRKYMEWLKKGHKEGEVGAEVRPDQTETEKHEHYRPGSRAAEEKVREWERELGRRRD